jgi:SPP1 gp7 family putative phage head morphogenesis protein
VSSGGDLKTLATSLREEYGLTKKRAALIARDQNRKATAVIHRDSLLDLGVTQAVWHHSHAGKTPRPSHVAANGKVYELSKGLLVEGEYIQPGQEINCRCTCRAIVPNVAV